MSRVCELSGKKPLVGNNVSHANNKTRRRFLPNLVKVSFMSESLERSYSFRVAASAIRTVEHNGGLDAYLLTAKENILSPRALRVKRAVQKHRSKAAA